MRFKFQAKSFFSEPRKKFHSYGVGPRRPPSFRDAGGKPAGRGQGYAEESAVRGAASLRQLCSRRTGRDARVT